MKCVNCSSQDELTFFNLPWYPSHWWCPKCDSEYFNQEQAVNI